VVEQAAFEQEKRHPCLRDEKVIFVKLLKAEPIIFHSAKNILKWTFDNTNEREIKGEMTFFTRVYFLKSTQGDQGPML
jgi:hypothetical protein